MMMPYESQWSLTWTSKNLDYPSMALQREEMLSKFAKRAG